MFEGNVQLYVVLDAATLEITVAQVEPLLVEYSIFTFVTLLMFQEIGLVDPLGH